MKFVKRYSLSLPLLSTLIWNSLRRTDIFTEIRRNRGAIEIVDDTFNLSRRELVDVPLIGTVAAGALILADENVENYFPIPAELLPNSETFMLKVRGNSMIDVGIYDGDRVIVEQTSVAENGEIVVALIDDSATVKRFFKENGHYRLQPENATMDPIIVDKVQILGKVIGLLRLMR